MHLLTELEAVAEASAPFSTQSVLWLSVAVCQGGRRLLRGVHGGCLEPPRLGAGAPVGRDRGSQAGRLGGQTAIFFFLLWHRALLHRGCIGSALLRQGPLGCSMLLA